MNKNKQTKRQDIAIVVGVALLFACWIVAEIRYKKYEDYAQKHNCTWQIIKEQEICK